MAMTMHGEVMLPADRETVWAELNDPEVLKACIPGCQELEKIERHRFQAVAKITIGPVKATFKGMVNSPISIRRTATRSPAKGRAASPASPRAAPRSRLADAEGGTTLTYDVEAQVGGKIAQLGGRLINGVAKKFADEFFANFAKQLSLRRENAA